MIITRFETHELADWVDMYLEFEAKLEAWSRENNNAQYDITLGIGQHVYTITLKIETETDTDIADDEDFD